MRQNDVDLTLRNARANIFFKVLPLCGGVGEARGRNTCGHCPHQEQGKGLFRPCLHASSHQLGITFFLL